MYQAVYIPQAPAPAFIRAYDTVGEALAALDLLSEFSNFEFLNNIKPDYCDVMFVQVWEDGEWIDAEIELEDYPEFEDVLRYIGYA